MTNQIGFESGPEIETYFAPAERDSLDVVYERYEQMLTNSCAAVFDAMPVQVMILNDKRQVVFGNKAFLNFINADGVKDVLGKRPGEALKCVHACELPGGCGTTEFCARCGAVQSILAGILGENGVRECRMLRDAGNGVEALDIEVRSTPFCLEGLDDLVLFTVSDISHVNRRLALERVFFHDIMNTAGALNGVSELLSKKVPEDLKEHAKLLCAAADRLINEITGQRDLLAAEQGELRPRVVRILASEAARAVERAFTGIDTPRNKAVVICSSEDGSFEADPVLLERILINMVKNGLESSRPGETVTLDWTFDRGEVEFQVHNPGAMEEGVRKQIFNRSFSTKGRGRGLGTYGMKLLGEKYLGGRVWFESTPESGTTFFIRLPLTPGTWA